MSGICLKRLASARRIAALPRKVRPTDSGPRARQKTPSSAKQSTMRSTSRLLNAAEISRIRSMVIAMSPSLLAGGAGAPQHVGGAVVVEPAAEHEQVVGEPVQVFDCFRVDPFGGGQRAGEALGAAGHRACEVQVG